MGVVITLVGAAVAILFVGDPLKGLIASQIALSIQLPITILLQIGLTSRRAVMVPGAKVSVVGMYRDEDTLAPVRYYVKLAKKIHKRHALILDPMLSSCRPVASRIRR